MQPLIQWLFNNFFPQAVKSFPNVKGKLFITFDDGPHPLVTPSVLEILKKFNAKATFFCLGENVEKYSELYNQILSEGHSVGNHTYSHINGLKCSLNKYSKDIEKAERFINSYLFRPPYGRMRYSQYRLLIKKGYKIILWDVVSYDYDENIEVDSCISNVIDHVKEGSVILFHDSQYAKKNVLNSLPAILDHFSKQQYSFESIGMKK